MGERVLTYDPEAKMVYVSLREEAGVSEPIDRTLINDETGIAFDYIGEEIVGIEIFDVAKCEVKEGEL